MDYTLQSLLQNDGFLCPSCGKRHFGLLKDCIIADDAIAQLPGLLHKYNVTHPFILCDTNTYRAAGEKVCGTLTGAQIPYTLHEIVRENPAPDERIVGEAVMYCDGACDGVIAVGSGVINDTCKIVAHMRKCPHIVVGTAPSMDGYASASSSMERSGLKVSLPSKCADAVVAEPAILAGAPKRMILSGIGDMLAKYVSIAEWELANILVGDYYCETVAQMVKASLAQCVAQADAAVAGDRAAAASVMEGLVIAGMAMNYAGVSRPASGMEHYISHITDMRALEFGTPADFHGIQCGVATLTAIRAYEKLLAVTPDREKALAFVARYDNEKWNDYLREKLGHGAQAIIDGEVREGKYDKAKHAARLEVILKNWPKITEIIRTLPDADELEAFMKRIGHPTTPEELGLTQTQWQEAFLMAKDIRDKYVLGRLLWDLGELEENI